MPNGSPASASDIGGRGAHPAYGWAPAFSLPGQPRGLKAGAWCDCRIPEGPRSISMVETPRPRGLAKMCRGVFGSRH